MKNNRNPYFAVIFGTVLFSVLTSGCGSPEMEAPHVHDGDDHFEQVYNQARILETWEKEGPFYISPSLQTNAPKNRIVIRFTIEKETPVEAAVPVWGQGAGVSGLTSPWEKISWTWIEAQSRVGILDFTSDIHQAQLKIHEDDMAYIDFIGFSLAFVFAAPPSNLPDGVSGAQASIRHQALEDTFEHAGVKTRADWEASAMGGCDIDTTDRYRVALHHTAGPQQHNASYAAQVRQTQQGHFANGWCDVGYHFLVTADGSTWEGRPLDYRGSHVGGNNSGNVGVAFVGCFNEGDVEPGWSCDQFPESNKHPSASLMENGGALLKLIVDHFDMTVNADTVKGHDDHPNVTKSCPGSYLSERLDELRTGALHGAPSGALFDLSPINDFNVTEPSPFNLYQAPSGGLYFNENDVCHAPIDDSLIHCTPEGSQQENGHTIQIVINDEYGDGNEGEGSIVNIDTGDSWYTISSSTVTGYGFEDTVCLPPGNYNFTYVSDIFSTDMDYKITNETMGGHVDADTESGDLAEGEDNPYVEVFFNVATTTEVFGFELTLRDNVFSGPRMDNVNGNQAQIHQICCSHYDYNADRNIEFHIQGIISESGFENVIIDDTIVSGNGISPKQCFQNAEYTSGYWYMDTSTIDNSLSLNITVNSIPSGNGDDESCGEYLGFQGCEVHYSFSQTLDMPAGWSIISTYIEEQDADGNTAMVVDEIFSEISDEVIILKDYLGAAWLKEWNFNGVGAIEFGKGYQIKLNNPASITFRGHRPLAETPLELPQGWSFIGYTRTYPVDPVAAFAPLVDEDNVIIVKDYLGAAYLPQWSFNGITELAPGLGYQIKLHEAATFSYLPDGESY